MFYENKPDFFLLYNETTPLQYPLHIHSYIEYVHVISGLIEMQIGDEVYTLKPGDIAFIFPNVPHKYHTLSASHDTQFYIMNSSVDILPMHKMELLGKYPHMPVVHPDPLHKDVLYAERRLFEITLEEENTPLISSLTSLILCHIFPLLQLNDFENTPPPGSHLQNYRLHWKQFSGRNHPAPACQKIWHREIHALPHLL